MRQKEAKQLAQVECLSDRTEAIADLAHQTKFSIVRSRVKSISHNVRRHSIRYLQPSNDQVERRQVSYKRSDKILFAIPTTG